MLYRFVDGVEKTYSQNVPFHLQDNNSSMMYKIDQNSYSKLIEDEVQEILDQSHMIITDCRERILQFNEHGLRQLKSLFTIVSIEGSF